MNEHVQGDTTLRMQAVEPSELATVEGGLGFLPNYIPLGDRMVVGCGTMILIDRMIPFRV